MRTRASSRPASSANRQSGRRTDTASSSSTARPGSRERSAVELGRDLDGAGEQREGEGDLSREEQRGGARRSRRLRCPCAVTSTTPGRVRTRLSSGMTPNASAVPIGDAHRRQRHGRVEVRPVEDLQSSSGRRRWTSPRAPVARPRPSAEAARETRALSRRSSRPRRTLPAPRAARTAVSLRRASPRARRRLATLMQAMRRRSATAAPTAFSALRSRPEANSETGRRRVFHGDASFSAAERSSARTRSWAWSRVTSSRRRAKTLTPGCDPSAGKGEPDVDGWVARGRGRAAPPGPRRRRCGAHPPASPLGRGCHGRHRRPASSIPRRGPPRGRPRRPGPRRRSSAPGPEEGRRAPGAPRR